MPDLRIAGFEGRVIFIRPVPGWDRTTLEIHSPDCTTRLHNRFLGPDDFVALHGLLEAAVLHDTPGEVCLDDAVVQVSVLTPDEDLFPVVLAATLDSGEAAEYEFTTTRLALWNLAIDVQDLLGRTAA
jgi:hypothetical protein